MPLQWAATQNSLGDALSALGEREGRTGCLEQAVEAYRGALEEYPLGRKPFHWAATHNNLGAALQVLSERENGTERLEQAVQAYRTALEMASTEDVIHQEYDLVSNNLNHALERLHERRTKLESASD